MRRKPFVEAVKVLALASVWIYLIMQTANWFCNGRLF